MKPSSYNDWATDIARCAVNPSLRPASCCMVVVRNGADGRRVTSLDSMLFTLNAALRKASVSDVADASSRWISCSLPLLCRDPRELKSRPWATRWAPTVTSREANSGGSASAPASRMASMSQ